MIIICGRTIAEVERDLEMAKAAIATGAPMGIGGATMADVEQALRGLRQAVGCEISNPNYVGVPPIEDEEIETCPVCDCELDEDGYCDNCGYPDEEELLDGLTAEDVDRITEQYGLPKAWAVVMKSVLGLR